MWHTAGASGRLGGRVPGQGIQVALDEDGGPLFVHGRGSEGQHDYGQFIDFVVHPPLPGRVWDGTGEAEFPNHRRFPASIKATAKGKD
jgi:hypothetical protein